MALKHHTEHLSSLPTPVEQPSILPHSAQRDPERWHRTQGWPPIGGASGEARQSPELQDEEPQPERLSPPEQGRIRDIQGERLAKVIHDIERGYDPSAHFEIQLILEGLLDKLEQARIVPITENPNPYDPDVHEDEHERWWAEHPQETEEFRRDVDKRNEILRCLYIGAVIGSGPWNLP